MEYADCLRSQITRYRHLLDSVALDSRAAAKVKAALTELEEQLRLETPTPPEMLRAG
jgi:hypothetical protein